MSKPRKIGIVIPCYNEQDNVLDLYQELITMPCDPRFEIIPVFINDCSSDQTAEILRQNNINFIDLPVNLGIGGAVQTGYKYCYQHGFDMAVQMDGDGQHPPAELYKILEPFLSESVDVVIGSRYLTKEGFQSTALRRTGINYFKWLNKTLVGVTISDSTSGYRALNRKAMELVSDYYPDEYPEPEAIILYSLAQLKIIEVPVTMRERQGGESSIKNFKAVYYMVKVTLSTLFLFISIKSTKQR